jgi:hypothetical protein
MGEDYWHGRSYQLRGTRTPAGTLAILSEGIWFFRNPAGDLAALRRSDGRLGPHRPGRGPALDREQARHDRTLDELTERP